MLFQAANDDGIVRIASTGARIDDDVHRRQFMLMLTKRFPDQTLDAIAAHRIPHDAGGNRQSKARHRRAGIARKYREKSVG